MIIRDPIVFERKKRPFSNALLQCLTQKGFGYCIVNDEIDPECSKMNEFVRTFNDCMAHTVHISEKIRLDEAKTTKDTRKKNMNYKDGGTFGYGYYYRPTQ